MHKAMIVICIVFIFSQCVYGMEQAVALPDEDWLKIIKLSILSQNQNEQRSDAIKKYCVLRSVSKSFKAVADDKTIMEPLYEHFAYREVTALGPTFYYIPLLGHIMTAAQMGKTNFFYFLLKTKPKLLNSPVDNNGSRLLHWAASYQSEEVTQFLLEQPDIDVNSKDNENFSALNYADNEKIRNMLFDAGCTQYSNAQIALKSLLCKSVAHP